MAFLSTDDSLKYLGNECFLCNLNTCRIPHAAYLTSPPTILMLVGRISSVLSSLKFKF